MHGREPGLACVSVHPVLRAMAGPAVSRHRRLLAAAYLVSRVCALWSLGPERPTRGACQWLVVPLSCVASLGERSGWIKHLFERVSTSASGTW